MQNHYEVLGIRKNADISEIKNAYRKLAQEYHPDKNPDDPVAAKKFIEISEAYQVLSDQAKRARYDLYNEYETTVTFISERQRRPPPPAFYHFKNKKVEFSRKAYIQGSVVVIVLLLMVFIVPFILLKITSKKQYELAINNYLAGRYYSALENIDMSIQDFGSKNSEACALAGVILVHKLKNYEYALKYIDKGLGYNPEDSLESEFHFLKGYCFDRQGNIPLALEEYHLVKDYSHTYDSSLFRQGVILSLRLTEYDSANAIFNELIDRNSKNYDAAYYQALVIQKQGKHELAIEKFKRLLSKNYEPAAVNYHIAWSEIKLDHIDLACEYLEKAQSYNLKEAKQLMNLYCKKDNSIFINPYH